MRLMFAAGDVGGARALAPVCVLAVAEGHDVYVLSHGALVADHADKAAVGWTWVEPAQDFAFMLRDLGVQAVAFASSVRDQTALNLAAVAQSIGLPVLHLLDNWSNYRARLERTSGESVTPNVYAVMDDLAAEAAQRDGVAAESIVVTGTPALADLRGPLPRGRDLVFVSEPVSQDQGRTPADPRFRGYTELQVLALVLEAVVTLAVPRALWVLPHPRETPEGLTGVLEEHGRGRIAEPHERERALAAAGAVIGMSSILLYESWLNTRPVLSVQPGLRLPDLRYLEGRPGLFVCERASDVVPSLATTLQDPEPTPQHLSAAALERARHRDAAGRVLEALEFSARAGSS